MGKFIDQSGNEMSFVQVPTAVLRSTKLDGYDKTIFSLILSCSPSFPSYKALQKWSGFSEERIWKSLRNLEECNVLWRFKRGRGVEYKTYFTISPDEVIDAPRLRFTKSTTSPDEARTLRRAKTNYIKEKDQRKRESITSFREEVKPIPFASLVEMAKARGVS